MEIHLPSGMVQLLKRVWSSKPRLHLIIRKILKPTHTSKVKRLKFASECETDFSRQIFLRSNFKISVTDNSYLNTFRYPKHFSRDYFHFFHPLATFFSIIHAWCETWNGNLNGALVCCGWHIRSFMISFDVLIRFTCLKLWERGARHNWIEVEEFIRCVKNWSLNGKPWDNHVPAGKKYKSFFWSLQQNKQKW